ncbi:adenosine deaminase [Saccharopolyspora lacisalsi]|uniref:adenosine deaminase n=1 Tax=Halosaccharopolyspora lacisalsi TaxID=1000566 RepID=A0A839DVA4_9PSEU|nr:adenosine deaminase [Halosaccharopolyspora lacisalsi]MBA8822748.1 adenosine deaminase [Halosaccharopolyspora lacisalsi]
MHRGSVGTGSVHHRRRRGAGRAALVALLAAASFPVVTAPAQAAECAPGDRECRVNRYLDGIRSNPGELNEFLSHLPKGGDLHNHLSGAASTESLIRYAAEDGRCIDTTTLKASHGPCEAGQRPASDAVTDPVFRGEVIRAWSMEDFRPTPEESGHDHFFATFGKFSAATDGRNGDMLAEVANDAARQRQFYVETLLSRQSEAVGELVDRVGFAPESRKDFARLRRVLLSEGLTGIEQASRRATDRDFRRYRRLLHCGTAQAEAGCAVDVRLDYQVARARKPARVFADILLGFELARSDPRFVGLNLVQPEDDPVALRDYTLHMRMIKYLRGLYPEVPVTLHAGELVPGLVKPKELTFHINQAVSIAGAERIGHGIDLRHEDDWRGLVERMARENIAVEVPLTSNCQILRVCGPEEHPLPTYLAHDVPVALSTDDPGVSRSDITEQYRRAVRNFGLDYTQLKASARTSLEQAFIEGASLWTNPDDHEVKPACATDTPGGGDLTASCTELLNSSPKAGLQWRQEAAFRAFEARYASKV